jgi:hypothetical protein
VTAFSAMLGPMWPFAPKTQEILEPEPTVDRVEEAARIRRAAEAELDRVADEKKDFRRRYEILTEMFNGLDTEQISFVKLPPGTTRAQIDVEWLRMGQRVGKALHAFSAAQKAESEAKGARR